MELEKKQKRKLMNNQEKIYSILLVFFITMIVLTNIIGVKLFEIFPNLLKILLL